MECRSRGRTSVTWRRIPNEPAFAGRTRRTSDPEANLLTGKVVRLEDDDGLLPSRRGTRAGLWIVLAVLAFGGAAAAGVYMFVIKDKGARVATPTPETGSAQADAGVVVEAPADAPEAPGLAQVDAARDELYADNEVGLRAALESLAARTEPPAQAVRAHLGCGLAQAPPDRASPGAGSGRGGQAPATPTRS